MAASRFSSDVIDMFYGPISREENERLQLPLRPSRDFDFRLVRTNFDEWLRVWKMIVPEGHKDLLKFAQKTKASFKEVIGNEIKTLKSVKTQLALDIKFLISRDGQKQEMEHDFRQRDPMVFNRNNVATVSKVFRQFIDEVKGKIEAWSQRGSGWVVEGVLEAFINVAQYQPFCGGSYIPLPGKLKTKKAIINVQNRDNLCLR